VKKLTIILVLALLGSTWALLTPAKTISRSEPTAAQDPNVFTHQDAGVRSTLPKGWTAVPDGAVTTVSTPDGLRIVFWVPDADTFDAAVKGLDTELGKRITNVKTTGKETRGRHNNMRHYRQRGTGEAEGVAIEWRVDVLGAKKPVLILSFGTREASPRATQKKWENAGKFIQNIRMIE
jgi:hypothetical protein